MLAATQRQIFHSNWTARVGMGSPHSLRSIGLQASVSSADFLSPEIILEVLGTETGMLCDREEIQ